MYEYPRRGGSISPLLLLVPLVLLIGFAAFQLLRTPPPIQAAVTVPPSTPMGTPAQAPLPQTGASILSITGLGTVATAGATTPRPIASVTKMMTAYVVLKDHPLRPGEAGPVIATTQADANRYLQMIREDQSALPVAAGTPFTQYQLLAGMLVPSANNFAEMLAAWDAGSQPAFVAKMNNEARSLGMTATTYADASGFSPGSVSTPADQLILARVLLQNPVFAEIVNLPAVTLPGIGLARTTNEVLGQEGIIGVKTGSTDEAGGNLVFAARRQVGGQPVEVVGAVFGQATRPLAFDASRRAVLGAAQTVQAVRVVAAGQPVATLDTEWGGTVDVVAAEDVNLLLWPGMSLEAAVELDAFKAPLAAGAQVGWLNLRLGEQERRIPVVLGKTLTKPDVVWKLTRI